MDTARTIRFFSPLLPLLAACSAGAAGDAVRPNDPTFAGARGESSATCHEVGDEGTPLIVDWKPEARGDLEVAMKQGVAVVHYDCNEIKVLPDCHVDGLYGFVGTSKKEQLITLENADQAKANLPLSGASIGASLARGSTLDIGLIMVGKTTTTSVKVDRSMLSGRCDGATHFVRSATLGAFAMKTTTAGEVKVAADVFGFGASGDSSSNKSATNKDGDVAACQSADPDASSAPKNCGAVVRVQLLGLGKEVDTKGPAPEVSCGKGLVASKGACVAAGTSAPHDCQMSDSVAVCTQQCDAGSAFSCDLVSLAYNIGLDVTIDETKSALFSKKGCDLGSGIGCMSYGVDQVKGIGAKRDEAAGVATLVKGCNLGDATSCTYLGDSYLGELSGLGAHLAQDIPRGVRYERRACYAGNGFACGKLGSYFADGKGGVAIDPARAGDLFKRGCAAKDKTSCARLRKG